jgi:hypothetical protein
MAPVQTQGQFARSHLAKLSVRYHGKGKQFHYQTMPFDVCLEWFRWAISHDMGSQAVRRGVLDDAQMPCQCAVVG